MLLPLLQLQTDLGSGEFSGDDACIAVTEVDKDFDVFQFHHEPLPCTNHCNFDERAKLFLREKCLLPRQKLKRACDAMGTGAHDVARDDTQISHFLGLMYGTPLGRYDDGPKNGVSFNISSILIRRNFSDPMPASTMPSPL